MLPEAKAFGIHCRRGMTELWGRLVVIDDDRQFVRALSKRVGPLVGTLLTCSSASGPFELPPTHEADVALFSTRLLGEAAVDLVRQVRASDHRAVLIARAWAPDGVDAVLLFDAGADDYVGAGDDLTVIEARIRRALYRRRCCERCTQRVPVSEVRELDPGMDLPEQVGMTRVEERIWNILRRAEGELVPLSALGHGLWRRSSFEPKVLYEHVSKLRRRLSGTGWVILNSRGEGYRLTFQTPCTGTDQSRAIAAGEPVHMQRTP